MSPDEYSSFISFRLCSEPKNSLSAVNSMFARLGTDYEIRNQWFFAILETMTTD